jgi:hypothetical protein
VLSQKGGVCSSRLPALGRGCHKPVEVPMKVSALPAEAKRVSTKAKASDRHTCLFMDYHLKKKIYPRLFGFKQAAYQEVYSITYCYNYKNSYKKSICLSFETKQGKNHDKNFEHSKNEGSFQTYTSGQSSLFCPLTLCIFLIKSCGSYLKFIKEG